MKKQIYLLLGLCFLNSTTIFGQWSLLGTIKSVPDTYSELPRYQFKKSGEKFLFYNNTTKNYQMFDSNVKFWKSYSKATQGACSGLQTVSPPNWNGETLSSSSDFEYVYRCNSNSATGLSNIGIADETGKSIHYFNELLADVQVYNSGVFTYSKPFLDNGADTLRDVVFYKNNNGVLTQAKTFKDTRYVAEVFSNNPLYNGTHYYELTKDRKLIIYKKDWSVFKTINLKMPDDIAWAAVNDFSVGVINNDTKWDFEIIYIEKSGFTGDRNVLDETGKILGKRNRYYYDMRGKVFIKSSDDYKFDTIFSMPQNQIIKVEKDNDFLGNTTGQFTNISYKYIISHIINKDSIVDIHNEKLELIRKVKIKDKPGFRIIDAGVVEQPDLSLVVIVTLYDQPNTKFVTRVIYPNNTYQDLDAYNSFRVAEVGTLEDRIIFRKSGTGSNYDFVIYSFGKLSSSQEIAALEGVKIFPNPTNSALTILIDNKEADTYKIRVVNLLGKEVWQGNLQNTGILTIDEFANLEAGIYVIEVKDQLGKVAIQKVLKN